MSVAPNSFESLSRSSSPWAPTATISPAPCKRAISMQSRPMGPGPITTTVSPGRTVLLHTTDLYATQKGSVMEAALRATPSGTRCRIRSGTLTYFVKAPSQWNPYPFRSLHR